MPLPPIALLLFAARRRLGVYSSSPNDGSGTGAGLGTGAGAGRGGGARLGAGFFAAGFGAGFFAAAFFAGFLAGFFAAFFPPFFAAFPRFGFAAFLAAPRRAAAALVELLERIGTSSSLDPAPPTSSRVHRESHPGRQRRGPERGGS